MKIEIDIDEQIKFHQQELDRFKNKLNDLNRQIFDVQAQILGIEGILNHYKRMKQEKLKPHPFSPEEVKKIALERIKNEKALVKEEVKKKE